MTTAASNTVESAKDRAAAGDPRATPAMRQYFRFKKQHPECVLFFRMGDFYEMFDDDARLCHRVLGITLTERTKGVPMAGVPYHAVESYLRRMIEHGYRVAVCEQVEDPKQAKGVVERAVTRVVTPGTLVDESLLDEGRPNHLAAIQFTEAGEASPAVLAMAELSTGSFTLHDLAADTIVDEVARLGVSELLHVEIADGATAGRVDRLRQATGCALTPRPAWTFRSQDARDAIREFFGVASLAGFGLHDDDAAIGPAGALLRYVRETQAQPRDESSGRSLAHLRPPRRESRAEVVMIDAVSLRALEVERTLRTGAVDGSLVGSLQRCRTPMGKRLLRQWLCFPSRSASVIESRQRAVGALVGDRELAEAVIGSLSSVQDVARIVGRVSMGRATPRDVVALGRSLAPLSTLAALLDGQSAFAAIAARLREAAASLAPLAEAIATSCVDDPPAHLREGGLFHDGIDAALDESRLLQRDGRSFLARYQKELIDETGIGSLKIGFNSVFGYYIEVSHANARRVPDSFTRRQTLRNAERYITPRLREFEEKITTAEARAIEREQQLFDRLCRDAAAQSAALSQFADAIAELDVLSSFGEHAVKHRCVRPTIVDEPVLDIRQGRHPVLDGLLGDRFVPNDCALGLGDNVGDRAGEQERSPAAGSASLALITGPNMAGKSTFIRQVALIVLLAHTGAFVPAEQATIGIVDRIFTRIGADDALHAGQSTFMVEMTETANILHHATGRSLVVLDEIGRGTSTLDGLSLAWAIAETLAGLGCRTLFATHYHELTALADRFRSVRNLHVSVREWGDDIVFLYRIAPGRTDRSYGIHVAKIAGLPADTIARARQILDTLAVHTDQAELEIEGRNQGAAAPSRGAQMSLFTEYLPHPAVERLRGLSIESMSPMQAFDTLRQLHDQARGG